jgi:predicted Zn finger-like uncharacterized protein
MATCTKCGKKGFGVRGHVLVRTCEICGTRGCNRCMDLVYVRATSPVKSSISDKVYGEIISGCCSNACYQTYWEQSLMLNPSNIMKIPFLAVFRPEFYTAHMFRLMGTTSVPSKEDIAMLAHYIQYPLAQGITMMYNGAKDLDSSLITDGLRICRNDMLYERHAKKWVDNLAERYIREFKRFDIPTNKAMMGGVAITLTVPQGQSQMKLHSCPSCGANFEKVAIRGQTVRCEFCSSTFEIT